MGLFWNATVTIRRQTLHSAFYGSNIITRSDHVSNDVWRARNLSASYIYPSRSIHIPPLRSSAKPPAGLCEHISREWNGMGFGRSITDPADIIAKRRVYIYIVTYVYINLKISNTVPAVR